MKNRRALAKFRTVSSVLLALVVGVGLAQTAMNLNGLYSWDGELWEHKEYSETKTGYLEVFAHSKDDVCRSDLVTIPGMMLLNIWLQAAAYLITLLYLFLGISIVADLFMG